MAILVVLSTLSMAWFFSANTAALDGLNSLPENVQIMVDDAQFFINNTESELVYVTNNNFDEFSENVDTAIEDIKTNIDTTIDTVIEDIHFDKLDDPFCLAQKLLRVNLSDIAAMGAQPYGYTLNLSIPKLNHELWLKKFCKGLANDTKKFNQDSIQKEFAFN